MDVTTWAVCDQMTGGTGALLGRKEGLCQSLPPSSSTRRLLAARDFQLPPPHLSPFSRRCGRMPGDLPRPSLACCHHCEDADLQPRASRVGAEEPPFNSPLFQHCADPSLPTPHLLQPIKGLPEGWMECDLSANATLDALARRGLRQSERSQANLLGPPLPSSCRAWGVPGRLRPQRPQVCHPGQALCQPSHWGNTTAGRPWPRTGGGHTFTPSVLSQPERVDARQPEKAGAHHWH
ncbi:UNVERIFIED_CONTAM: hypothetical protein K2H54_048576 [Gekko kuhli]